MHVALPQSTIALLREMAITSIAAGMLPIPILLATDRPEIACLYLGLACAWLSTEIFRLGGLPETAADWSAKARTTAIAVTLNAALFIGLGTAADVQTSFPFPLMAVLSVSPSLGLVPWLLLRVQKQYAALVFAAFIVGAAKIAACVVARIVYGPNYIEAGYVAGDWRTAKLMISLFWMLTATGSWALLLADWYRFHRQIQPRSGDVR